MTGSRKFPVAEFEFGFGSLVLGTVGTTTEKIEVGYMNRRPSARNNGSRTVSAILWPELAAVLESSSTLMLFYPCLLASNLYLMLDVWHCTKHYTMLPPRTKGGLP